MIRTRLYFDDIGNKYIAIMDNRREDNVSIYEKHRTEDCKKDLIRRMQHEMEH